jgi:hypothetical protein
MISMRKSNKSFILCIFFALVSLAIGVAVLPVFGLGSNILSAVIALALGACMIAFVLPEIMSTRGIVCVLNFFEFLLIAIVALLLVIHQLMPFLENANCRLLAIALWIHGMISIFKTYNIRVATARMGVPFSLLLNIIFITFATYLFVVPFIPDFIWAWACPIFFFIFAFLMIALSVLYAPGKAKR